LAQNDTKNDPATAAGSFRRAAMAEAKQGTVYFEMDVHRARD
jgi:hypothetical protein